MTDLMGGAHFPETTLEPMVVGVQGQLTGTVSQSAASDQEGSTTPVI